MTKPRKGTDGWRDGKGQIGIDGNKDAGFSRRGTDPWDSNPRGNFISRDGGRYTNNESGLRNKAPDESVNSSHDIFDNVERNSGGSDRTGAIKYGVD